jgi:hypothetical protein
MNAMTETANPKYFINCSFSLLIKISNNEPTIGIARRYVSKYDCSI